MRYKVKIETLSSVHVGSGEKKVLGIDFLYDNEKVYFLDTLKIGDKLNVASTSGVIEKWSESILKGKQKQFLKEHNVDYKKLSRSVCNYVDEFSDRAPSISMMMRDGRGIAYIPGSSIKGAIRTAIFAQLAKNEIKNAHKKAKEETRQEQNRKKAKRIEENSLKEWANNFFGKVSEDSFRFLLVGDAFFEKASTAVINTVQIKKDTKNHKQSDIDTIKQYAEVLLLENSSCFILDLDSDGFRKALDGKYVNREVPQFKDVTALFKAINNHTQSLVQSEMNIWDGISGAESIHDFLDFIDGEIEACNAKECILRLGNGSGKRFITGGVLEEIDFDREAIPKTRRIEIVNDEEDSIHYDLLGFVKLSLIDD